MLKKFLFNLFLILSLFPITTHASDNSLVKIGNNYYDTLEEAITNALFTDTITLLSNTTLKDSLIIDKTVNLNLNGNDIIAPTKVFLVQGGTLNITGKGTIKESEPNYGAIMVIGSSNNNDHQYSVVNISEDVTLEGWSGIFITHENTKSYGVVVNFAGKINAVNDTQNSSGIGIYVNGNIKDQTSAPVVNILDNAKIISNGNGLYIAGYGIFNIGKSYISGLEAGIGIKSGILNINGATVVCNGEDNTPTPGYNNGMKSSGTTIQIESNNGYAGNIELNIQNGNFTSKNSNVIYEYIGKGNKSLVNSINLSGGTFKSEANKDVIAVSNSFKEKHNTFISGGKYSSNPSTYLNNGYTASLDNDLYIVTKSTMKEVNNTNNNATNNKLIWPITIVIILISCLLMFFNKLKLYKLFRN